MSKTDDAADEPDDDDEMLPDEHEVIAERLDSLAEGERLSLSDVEKALESDG